MTGLGYFPLPHLYRGAQSNGSLRRWPDVCDRCQHHNCEEGTEGEVGLCSYGLNYLRVDEHLLIAGIVLEDYNPTSPARRKQLRDLPVVLNSDFDGAVHSYVLASQVDAEAVAIKLREREDEILDEEQFRTGYLGNLKKDIQKGLSFFHDYKQINSQIIQNINVVLEERYDGSDLQAKLQVATHAERAIYWAARFLEEKLNVAKFLLRPEWLDVPSECRRFRVHGMVMKYVHIYQSFFETRSITLKVLGESHAEIVANPSACGVIPHTMIDNALKYAPSGSTVEVFVEDQDDGGVYLDVACYGPELKPGEERAIFRPFFRGEAAKSLAEEGAGYGLYVSQLIAKQHLDATIGVEQDGSRRFDNAALYWTAFRIVFPECAVVANRQS